MEMDSQPTTSSGNGKKKRKSKMKVFQNYWLHMDIFKDWLTPHKNNEKALCTVCDKVLVCGKLDLIRHSKTKTHIENLNISRNVTPSALSLKTDDDNQDNDDNSDNDNVHVNKVKSAEIRLAAFFAEHNVAFQTINHMVPLLKEICSDSQVVKDLKLSRRKCVQIIKNVSAKRVNEDLITQLKNQKFSILVDESPTNVNDKLLCILVKYVTLENRKCVTELLELIPLNTKNCSAQNLYFAFQNCFKSKGIPISNIVGIACDNASVMTGVRDSFISRLKEEVPRLIVVNCICHSTALITSKACAKLPDVYQNVLHAVATYFSNSAKKSAILCEFQNYFKVESRKILKLSTRWLVVQKCIVKLLDNWEILKHYFQSEVVENPNRSARTILNILNDNKIKAYMLFLKYSLSTFNNFNAMFQGREILIHVLAETSENLIKQLGSNFLQPHVLQNMSIDVINPQNFLPLTSIYLGPQCESFLEQESSECITEVRSTCLSFYITALEEMIKRLPHNDEIFRDFKFLDFNIALREESRLTFPDLRNVARRFEISDVTALAYEWRTLPFVFNDADKTLLANLKVDDMWKNIFQKKNFDDDLLFPNLEDLVYTVLTLPHSNAEAEKIFSIVTDVKSKKRNRLDIDCLDAICKVRSHFWSNNINCYTFKIDETHIKLNNYKNLYLSESNDQ